ncbi:DUF1489 family protein [Ahrensia marina]|uniref:Lysophospholipase n=1 Tax=Ahrensia marina TaxID=1514904 RepID=A0A0N0E7V6_9HYPH|nr:DUF1489 domain-containing protein [Ahrensia marina]KPB01615.1 lysophospholipase [Ahrensia marina]
MALNLIKLCVGVETVDDLAQSIERRKKRLKAAGQPIEMVHTTRMSPKRADEIIGEGSLYWVIKSRVQCRQKIIDLRTFKDNEGISRCDIVMSPELVLTAHQPKRPFQGWRYFKAEDTPRDLSSGETEISDMPEEMRAELADLGLI